MLALGRQARAHSLQVIRRALHCSYSAGASGPPSPKQAGQLQARKADIVAGDRNPHWVPVVHKETGLTYWWNQTTGETTALGEPMPGPHGRRRPSPFVQGTTSLAGLLAAGAGIGLVFAVLGRIL